MSVHPYVESIAELEGEDEGIVIDDGSTWR
jgi:hypothetical protein